MAHCRRLQIRLCRFYIEIYPLRRNAIPFLTFKKGNKYVTYVFGNGSFDYEDIGAKVPYEMDRDADNDQDVLYSRERIVIAPYGFSYKKANQATLSPTNEELADGSNWELVKDGEGHDINHKEIAIARIISPVEA